MCIFIFAIHSLARKKISKVRFLNALLLKSLDFMGFSLLSEVYETINPAADT